MYHRKWRVSKVKSKPGIWTGKGLYIYILVWTRAVDFAVPTKDHSTFIAIYDNQGVLGTFSNTTKKLFNNPPNLTFQQHLIIICYSYWGIYIYSFAIITEICVICPIIIIIQNKSHTKATCTQGNLSVITFQHIHHTLWSAPKRIYNSRTYRRWVYWQSVRFLCGRSRFDPRLQQT